MKKNIPPVIVIIALGFLIYSNAFHGSFVFDDFPGVRDNQLIRDLAYYFDLSRAEAFPTYDAFQSRYIGYLSFALNYRLNGLDVTGYHVVNVVIHILNGILVFLLVRLTFGTPFFRARVSGLNSRLAALVAGLLFVSHPIQTQAVTYIVQRFASLATLFFLLSLVLYVKARLEYGKPGSGRETDKKQGHFNTKSVLFYLSSVLCSVLAMKTKQNAFTLPVIVALYEFLFFEGRLYKRVLALVPLILTMAIIPASLVATDRPVGEIIGNISESTRLLTSMSRWDYLLTQFRVIVTYLRLLVFPVNQNLDYDYPLYHSFFHPAVLSSFLLLVSLAGLGLFLLHRSRPGGKPAGPADAAPLAADYRLIAFGIFWFFITLLVESSVIPIVDVIFEHRVYLPSVGMFIAAATALDILFRMVRARRPRGERAILAVLAVIIVALGVATYQRNTVWQTGVTLWEDVVAKSPNKARAHNILGFAYARERLFDQAREQYLIALRLQPDYFESYFNLGVLYLEMGRRDDARTAFESVLKLQPDHQQAMRFLDYVRGTKQK